MSETSKRDDLQNLTNKWRPVLQEKKKNCSSRSDFFRAVPPVALLGQAWHLDKRIEYYAAILRRRNWQTLR